MNLKTNEANRAHLRKHNADPAVQAVIDDLETVLRETVSLCGALKIAAEEKMNEWSESEAQENGAIAVWTADDEKRQIEEWIDEARQEQAAQHAPVIEPDSSKSPDEFKGILHGVTEIELGCRRLTDTEGGD